MQDQDLLVQCKYLEGLLRKSPLINKVLATAPQLKLPEWYLGAGAVAQTVWNERHGYDPAHGIKDCDLVYFDPDTSSETQDKYIQKGTKLFNALPIEVEITNEARVHLWYRHEFGREMVQYRSTEEAINTWPTTATAVGVRYEGDSFKVYAPYGLHDLLAMIVRPNKTLITQKVYEDKVRRWKKVWPSLKVVPWES